MCGKLLASRGATVKQICAHRSRTWRRRQLQLMRWKSQITTVGSTPTNRTLAAPRAS